MQILSFFLLGLSFGFGPCMSSCGPILISYIAGRQKNVLKSLSTYWLFSLGRIFAYLILGLLFFSFGKLMAERLLTGLAPYVFILGGAFIMVVGILLAAGKRIESGFCAGLYTGLLEKDKYSIFIFGLIIGLIPCAPLVAVFSSQGLLAKSWFSSLLYMFSFGAGTALSPLVLLVVFAAWLPRISLRQKALLGKVFNLICGLILAFMGGQLIWRVF